MSTTARPIDAKDQVTNAEFFTAPWGQFAPNLLQSALIGLTRRTPLQRGKARHKMTRMITGMGRPLDIRFRDLKFRIEGRNNLIEYGLLTRPSYNATEIEFLKAGLPEGGVALDIGSNIGLYSIPLAAHAGSDGTLLAIDANAQMTRHLQWHAQINGCTGVRTLTNAVGPGDGQVTLMVHFDDLAIASVQQTDQGGIQMRSLADIVMSQGLERIDVLKIDIEGHEDQALVPFFETMPEQFWPARIVIEFLPPDDYPGCAQVFKTCGYRLVGRTRNNSMYQRP